MYQIILNKELRVFWKLKWVCLQCSVADTGSGFEQSNYSVKEYQGHNQ